jgi:2-iminoacetate synthase ThiH
LWAVIPTPEGEPYGLDTIRFTALCRLELPAATHVVAEVETLGPRLAQMCLGFGANELFAQIMSERALRLGDNANNPVLTRKEAVTLIRGAGLVAAERLVNDVLEDALEEVT